MINRQIGVDKTQQFREDQVLSQADRSELFGSIIDIFEDWLESKGISPDDIPNPERNADPFGPDNLAIIFGSDYDELADKLSVVLGISRYEPDVTHTDEQDIDLNERG